MKNTIQNKIVLVTIKKIINFPYNHYNDFTQLCNLFCFIILSFHVFLRIDLQKLDLYEKTFLAPRENRKSSNLRIRM